ncbi:MAG TPA: AAA family ATPase [Jatrophihabitantaceae bacterium]
MDAGLLGRDAELAELGDRLDAAFHGDGALVVIAGEPGIGKTTLLAAVIARAATSGVPVLAGRAIADEGMPALWPWRRVLDGGAELGLRRELLAVDDGPADEMLFVALERTVQALIGAGPLIITLEDLHWADPATLRLLRLLAGELPGSRLLVVATSRPSPADLPGRRLELGPLSEADVAAWLGDVHPAHPSWPPYLHRQSGGNPLYLRELARVAARDADLTRPAVELPMPDELRRVAGYRFTGLSADCRHLLGGASALGEEFDVTTLAAAAGTTPDLAEALTAGVLVDDPAAPNRLRFSHALVRRARYEDLTRAERIDWHHRIAEALPPGSAAATIARHRVRAAVDEASARSAIDACRAAGQAATHDADSPGAHHWFQRAAELLDTAAYGDDGRAELLLELATAAYRNGQLIESVARCADVLELAERLDRADLAARAAIMVRGTADEQVNRTIVSLCERAGALLGDNDALRARVAAQQTLALTEVYDYATAEPISRQALALAEQTADRVALVDTIHARHNLATGPDGVTERLAVANRLRTIGPVPERPDAPMWGHIWRIDAALQVGAIHEVDSELAALERLADQLGWPVARWHLTRARATRALIAGEYSQAEELTHAARALGFAMEDESILGQSFAFAADLEKRTGRFRDHEPMLLQTIEHIPLPLVWAGYAHYRLAQGDRDAAERMYARVRPTLASMPVDTRWLPTVDDTCRLAAAFGDRDVAAWCRERLLPYAAYYVASVSGYRGSVSHALAIADTALGDLDAADRRFGDAEAMETRIGAPGEAAIVRLAHARMLAQRDEPGDRRRAQELAEQAALTGRRLGMDLVLAGVNELTETRQPLTAREREIAMLVADGLANRAIAERLVLSERTVETHVRNALTKLDLANRTQLTAWALRAGLRN